MIKRLLLPAIAVFLLSFFVEPIRIPKEDILAQKVELGRELFFDKTLSDPDGQSCTVCHAPKTAFSDPDHKAVSEGMQDGFFVNRNSQSLAYVSFIPSLSFDTEENLWKGGFFWDGRSNTLQHQLSGPFFNIAEMNNSDTAMVVRDLKNAAYYKQFKKVYGRSNVDSVIFKNIVDALVHFERSATFNEFTSKYDYFIQGKVSFTDEELFGMELFQGKAECVQCHSLEPVNGAVMFSNYGYYNLGIPRNESNPFYTTPVSVNPHGNTAIDLGIGPIVKDENHNGKFRTPTLRNVQYTSPYFHNGAFDELSDAVHFINTRDDGKYASAEVPSTVDHSHTGRLGLNREEEDAIVAFLLTLSDGYEIP